MNRDTSGFTLLELLIVMVIMGILVLISIPRFTGARDKAYRAQMQTDLRTLVTAEEAYYDDNQTYTTQVNLLDYNKNPNVTINVLEANGSGYSAEATHLNTSAICGFYMGSVTPPASVTVTEGIIDCTP